MIRRHRASRRITYASSNPVLTMKFAEDGAATRRWTAEKSDARVFRSRIGRNGSKKRMVVRRQDHIS
jgi:hypothetical protein